MITKKQWRKFVGAVKSASMYYGDCYVFGNKIVDIDQEKGTMRARIVDAERREVTMQNWSFKESIDNDTKLRSLYQAIELRDVTLNKLVGSNFGDVYNWGRGPQMNVDVSPKTEKDLTALEEWMNNLSEDELKKMEEAGEEDFINYEHILRGQRPGEGSSEPS